MKLSPEVCFGPRNNRLHFGDDADYDPYTGSGSHGFASKVLF